MEVAATGFHFANHFQMTTLKKSLPDHSLIGEQIDSVTGNAVFRNDGSLELRGMDFTLSRNTSRRVWKRFRSVTFRMQQHDHRALVTKAPYDRSSSLYASSPK